MRCAARRQKEQKHFYESSSDWITFDNSLDDGIACSFVTRRLGHVPSASFAIEFCFSFNSLLLDAIMYIALCEAFATFSDRRERNRMVPEITWKLMAKGKQRKLRGISSSAYSSIRQRSPSSHRSRVKRMRFAASIENASTKNEWNPGIYVLRYSNGTERHRVWEAKELTWANRDYCFGKGDVMHCKECFFRGRTLPRIL